MSNEHEWLPELPSLEEMVDARNKFMLTQPENQQYFIGLHIGKLDFRRNYAKPYRDACLVLLEAMEDFYSAPLTRRQENKANEAIETVKGIFQK